MVTDLPSRVLGGGDVQIVRQPATRELRVAGFLVEAVATEPEGVVDRDPLGAEHGERVAQARGGLGVAAGEDGAPPVVELDDQRARRLGAGFLDAAGNVTLGSANVTLPGRSVASVVGERHHGAEGAVAEPDQLGLATGVSEVAERTRWFFSKMIRSPTLNALAPILISAPSSPAAWRRARTISFERGDIGPADGQDGGGVGRDGHSTSPPRCAGGPGRWCR